MNWLVRAVVFWLVLLTSTQAQELKVGGFLEFEARYGDNYDIDGSVDELAYGVDGALNFDYKHSTKAGLEYGAHFELDFFQSDDLLDGELRGMPSYDVALFNDGYVYVNTAFGKVSIGDVDVAGRASNQLNVPMFSSGAFQIGPIPRAKSFCITSASAKLISKPPLMTTATMVWGWGALENLVQRLSISAFRGLCTMNRRW